MWIRSFFSVFISKSSSDALTLKSWDLGIARWDLPLPIPCPPLHLISSPLAYTLASLAQTHSNPPRFRLSSENDIMPSRKASLNSSKILVGLIGFSIFVCDCPQFQPPSCTLTYPFLLCQLDLCWTLPKGELEKGFKAGGGRIRPIYQLALLQGHPVCFISLLAAAQYCSFILK